MTRTAILTPSERCSGVELFERADRIARALGRSSVSPGRLVGLALENSVDFVAGLLAAWKCELVAALISPRYGRDELREVQRGVGPALFLTRGGAAERWKEVLRSEHAEEIPGGDELVLVPGREPASGPVPLPDVALVKLSSGSTAAPKGVALTAANVIADCESVTRSLGLSVEDHIFCPVPASHSYGFDLGVLASLWSGATLSLRESFVPRAALRDVAELRASVFLGVPSIYRLLLETRWSSVPDLSCLRRALCCTAHLSPAVIEAFRERFGVTVTQHYGSTETGAVALHEPDRVPARPDSVGRAMHGVRIEIQDASGRGVGPGIEGELVVRSPAVAAGYLMGAPAGASPLEDGCFRTGDLARIDAEGFLTVSGRMDGLINVGGLKVSPGEVERALESHPGVREAAVIGVPEPGGSEGVYAAVAASDALDPEELFAHCRLRLADYKIPRRIRVLSDLPRGPSGKVRLLAEDLQP